MKSRKRKFFRRAEEFENEQSKWMERVQNALNLLLSGSIYKIFDTNFRAKFFLFAEEKNTKLSRQRQALATVKENTNY